MVSAGFPKAAKEDKPHAPEFVKSLLVLFQPLKNCHSEQQIEVISVIVQQVIVTELTKRLISV